MIFIDNPAAYLAGCGVSHIKFNLAVYPAGGGVNRIKSKPHLRLYGFSGKNGFSVLKFKNGSERLSK